MHDEVYTAFERLCRPLAITGKVLEIGASPFHQSLLTLPCLSRASGRIGVGLDGAFKGPAYEIRQMNAHALTDFDDGAFQLVLSNSMLEHDPQFWLTLAEARRVTARGGHLALGVPGYVSMGTTPLRKLFRKLVRLPLVGHRWRDISTALDASSLTLGIHDYPGDYYRFSTQAMAEVLLAGMVDVTVQTVLSPPRILGIGRKP